MNSLRFRLTPLLLALALVLSLASGPVRAATPSSVIFSFKDFASISGLTLNGSATQVGSAVRLVSNFGEAGSVYDTTAVPTGSFATQFELSMHDGSSPPADGMAFILQNGGLNALGGSGSQSGIPASPPVSVAVSFRVYGGCANTVNVVLIGQGTGDPNSCGAASVPAPFSLYGTPFYAWVNYSAAMQQVQVFVSRSTTKPSSPLVTLRVDVAGALGPSAYAGFTAGAGGLDMDADVLNWQFSGRSTSSQAAFSINHPGFSSVSDLTLNGSATQAGSALRLVPALGWQAGSAFYTSLAPTDGTDFHTQFAFNMHDGSHPPADGMAFVLQSGGLNALGDAGSNAGIPPCEDGIPCTFSTPSVAVSFRVYGGNADGSGGCANHVSLVLDDENAFDPTHCGVATAAAPFSLYGGPVWVWIDYSASKQRLQVYVSQTSTEPGNPVLTYNNLNLTNWIGPVAYAGFTGGTGGLNLNADVLNWQFTIPRP